MEPFALFNLLQSFLRESSAPREEQTSEKNVDVAEEKTTELPPETAFVPTPSQEAALQFLSAHETRAKRTKK